MGWVTHSHPEKPMLEGKAAILAGLSGGAGAVPVAVAMLRTCSKSRRDA
jgi:hypothetical protein